MKYTNEKTHKELLACVANAAIALEEQDLEGCKVSVDAEFLLHTYELLLAYAHTYEHHQIEVGADCSNCSC